MDFLNFIKQDGGSLSFRHGQWTYQSNLIEGSGDEVEEALDHYKRLRENDGNPDRMYAIGVDDGKGGYGMTAGPTPMLSNMLDYPGQPGQFVIGFKTDADTAPIYEWVVDEWLKISDPNWSRRLHRESCPSVQIGGSPEKCTCDRRGRYIRGRRGPRQPGDYDS